MVRNIGPIVELQAEILSLLQAGPFEYAAFIDLLKENDLGDAAQYLRSMKRNGQIRMWIELDPATEQAIHKIALPL